jgi:diguanylate cyclase (GGDEF)-like protein
MDERIRHFRDAALALSEGRLEMEIDPGEGDELANLGEALRLLARSVRDTAERSAVLADITQKINQGLVIEDVLDQVYENFFELIPYDRIGFALLDEGKQVVRSHWARSQAKAIRLPLGYQAELEGTSLEKVMETGTPRILNDLEAYLEDNPKSESTRLIVEEGMRSSLTCPLLVLGQPVGFLFFSSLQKNAYRGSHQDLFLQIAGQLAMTLEKSRLYQGLLELTDDLRRAQEDLEQLASRDSLTGLWNRRSISELLEREVARASRDEVPLTAVIVDIDHFKKINDRIGHLAGDEVLREVTRRIAGTLRSADMIGRLGGEEFLAILNPANEETAVQVMERARRACAREPVIIEAGEIDVTVSLGAAVVRDYHDADIPTILKTADHALYRAKNDGRNRSVFEVV